MLRNISISNKYSSFELSIHVFYFEIYFSSHKIMKQIVKKNLSGAPNESIGKIYEGSCDWVMAAKNSASPWQE